MMERRAFLKGVAAAGAMPLMGALAAPDGAAQPASPIGKPAGKLRGVNLGGWLVLERWMVPSVYAGTDAKDEYTLCQTLGKEKATERLKRHRETWITDDDFKWLAARGLNAVRLPIAYGVAEENPPYITGLDTLDWAFRTAEANGIGVLLDLHGVPGSQNGWDHSGRAGTLGWHSSPENIAHSLRIVEGLAKRYAHTDSLIGFELLNEPRQDVPLDILKTYYRDAYKLVRKHIPAEKAAVVIHDSFRPYEWADAMPAPDYANVLLDTHPYGCFTEEDRKRDIYAHVEFAAVERKRQLDRMQQQLPCIVGEWSCALNGESLRGLRGFARNAGIRAYGAAQLISWETSRGWFFWSYKLESGGEWSFRDCVNNGWLPDKFGEA